MQIEEDEHEELDELENPFEDDEGAASSPQGDEPVPDEPQVKVSNRGAAAGGEQGFDWTEYESEPEVEAACLEEARTTTAVEESVGAADDQQGEAFRETETVDGHTSADEAQVEEAQVTEEVHVEETQEAEERQEAEETQKEEAQDDEVQITEIEEVQEEEAQEEQATEVAEAEETQAREDAEAEDEAQVTEEALVEESKSVRSASEEEEQEEE